MKTTIALSVAATLACAAPAMAQDFYKGKTVSVVIGYTPGGGYDTYGRLLSRHIGRHIPGAPTVMVQNLPGAGSLNAVRQSEATLPKDGTAIIMFNPALVLDALVNPQQVKFNFTESNWVGSIAPEVRVCYTWGKTNIKNWDDLAAAKEINFGATGRGSTNFVNAAMLKRIFNINVKHVLGFPGSAELKLAIERGELDADCGSYSSIPAEWLSDKKINLIVSFSAGPSDVPPEVPYAGKFAKTPEQKELLDIFGASGELGRPVITSKAVPADRVKIIRAAFDATMTDPQFLEEARKLMLPVVPVDGEKAAQIIRKVFQANPETITKVREIME